MCGAVRISRNAAEAVEFALAYAKSFEAGPQYQRDGAGLDDDSKRLDIAREFIAEYVPANQRSEARTLLDARPDLETELNYWTTVVDDRMGAVFGVVGTKRHDSYEDYGHRSALAED
jgi:hypothetical protein